ncbi:MAG TPA: ribosome silencing factor [Flavobacteriaceae bacterium]|nr:ribosome silencing factor [Flavobacteriaceae bacterium]
MTENNKDNDHLISLIVQGIEDIKGKDIEILDLRDIENTVCDYFVFCTGNSSTQVNAIEGAILKTVSRGMKEKPWHIEATSNAKWVLIDYVSVVVHIFQPDTRDFYDIEGLWGDAKSIKIESSY